MCIDWCKPTTPKSPGEDCFDAPRVLSYPDRAHFHVSGMWKHETVLTVPWTMEYKLSFKKIAAGLREALVRSPRRLARSRLGKWRCDLCGKNKEFDSGGILLMHRESSAKRPLLSLDAIWSHPSIRPPAPLTFVRFLLSKDAQAQSESVLRKTYETEETKATRRGQWTASRFQMNMVWHCKYS